MITDLVTPLLAGEPALRDHHAALLESLRRATTPLAAEFPLARDRNTVRTLAAVVADEEWTARLRRDLRQLASAGVDGCREVIVVASDGSGPIAGAVPPDRSVVALEHGTGDALRAALATVAVQLTRWRGIGGGGGMGGFWEMMTALPLRELLYVAGIGAHAGAALLPNVPPHRLLGLTAAAFQRLREQEQRLGALLRDDLDESGAGLILRWLVPGSAAASRRVAGITIPSGAGHYLAWRMIEPRIRRIGIQGAMAHDAA